ncbi:hypothetical protein SDC9_61450 [bioreactor metagenome]|uniref:Uncharacterized protein n=1 Tax=bioreactor metagenome TaxID=1076179 RepID=A0A644XLW5_9ZZZZ
MGKLFIQAVQHFLLVVEVPVQINFGKQQGKVLKVLHVQHMSFLLVTLLGNALPVSYNVQVVTAQGGMGNFIHFYQGACELVKIVCLSIFCQAFKPVCPQSGF